MSGKRFRARIRYANTRLWSITAIILILGGFALHAVTRNRTFPEVALAIGVAGVAFGLWQDRRERSYYGLEGGELLLKRGRGMERLPLDVVQDVSLVDRRAARDLLLDRKRILEELGRVPAEREEFLRQSLRWCSVDIGLGVFGFGNDVLDRRPDGKYDLVLLRLRDGRIMLLSPVHNQDLISALNKGKIREERRQDRA